MMMRTEENLYHQEPQNDASEEVTVHRPNIDLCKKEGAESARQKLVTFCLFSAISDE